MLTPPHLTSPSLITILLLFTACIAFHLTPTSSVYYVNSTIKSTLSSGTNFTYPMMLAPYTSHILLPNKCLNFSSQPCDTLISCSSSSSSSSPSSSSSTTTYFPYFSVTGQDFPVNLTVFPDIQENIAAGLVTQTCDSQGNSYGSQSYGLIGLGTWYGSSENAVPIFFSIYLNPDPFSNVFILFFDSNKSKSDAPAAVIPSDANWHILNQTINVSVADSFYDTSASIIFDLNFNGVGLPLDIYSWIINQLNSTVACTENQDYQATNCEYTGTIEDLPDVNIRIGGQIITITPQIYVQNGYVLTGSLSTFSLNFRGLGNNLTGQSYVTQLYQGYIIMGSPVMTYYYTLFNQTGTAYSIDLYVSSNVTIIPFEDPSSPSPKESMVQLFIILGIILFCVALYVSAYCWNKRRKAENENKDDQTKEIALISLNNSENNASKERVEKLMIPIQTDENNSPIGPSPLGSPSKGGVVEL